MEPRPPRSTPTWERLLPVALWVACFGWVLRPIWGIDIFRHVALGRYVLEHGMPRADAFSAAHPDAPFASFETGYEVVVAWLEARFGLDGLRFVHAAVLATALVALFATFRRLSSSRLTAGMLLALLMLVFDDRVRLRPHVVNLLMEALVVLPFAAGAWRGDAGTRRRWLVTVGLVSLVWASLHAMAVLWFIAVCGTVLVAGPGRRDRLFGAAAVALVVLGILLAPGALAGIRHTFTIIGGWGDYVAEMQPSWVYFDQGTLHGKIAGAVPWLAVAAVLVVAAVPGLRPAPERRATWLAAAGHAFGAVYMVRMGYYAVFVFALLAPELAQLARRVRLTDTVSVLLRSAVAVGSLAILVAHVSPRFAGLNRWTTTIYPGGFPVEELALLRRAGIGGRVFNEAGWGGYVLYALGPDVTVLSDARVCFQEDVDLLLRADMDPRQRPVVAERAYREFGVDLLVRRRGAFPRSPEWELLVTGPVAEVWSRAGPVTASRHAAIAATAGSGSR